VKGWRWGWGCGGGGGGGPNAHHDIHWFDEMHWGDESGLNGGSYRVDTLVIPLPVRKRKARVQGQFPELSAGSSNDISEYDFEDEEDAPTSNVGSKALKHAYRDET
jgi:hypothetical protein